MISKNRTTFIRFIYMNTIILVSLLWLTACTASSPAPAATPIAQTKVRVTAPAPIPNPTTAFESPITPTMAMTPLFTQSETNTETPIPSDLAIVKQISETDPVWGSVIRQVSELRGFYTLALSPDGATLAVIGTENDVDYYLRLWDIATGNIRLALESNEPIGGTSLTFSPDGTLLASAASGTIPYVFVWNVVSGVQLHKFPFPDYNSSISFSPDGKLLAVSSYFEGAMMWNLKEGSSTQLGPGIGVNFASGVPNSLLAIARGWQRADEPSPVRVWDIDKDQVDYFFPNSFYADGISFSPEGELLAAVIAGEDGIGYLRLWNLQENAEVPIEKGQLDTSQTRQIGFSSEDHLAVLSSELVLWDVEGHFIKRFEGEPIQNFMFTSDGGYLLAYDFSGGLQVWQLATP